MHSPDLSAVGNSAVAALAVAAALGGDLQTAASSLGALCGRDLARLPRSSSWLGTMNGIVETAALLGDAEVSPGLRAAPPVRQPAGSARPTRSSASTCGRPVHTGIRCSYWPG